MSKPLCYVSAEPFLAPISGKAPSIEDIDIKVMKSMGAGQIWPEEEAERVEIIFGTHMPINLAAFTNLRWVQIESSGFSHLFPFGLDSRPVTVTNARGIFDSPIAEWNIAMMTNLVRDVRSLIRNQETRIWDRSARFTGELRGKTVGIWGYGGIGRQTARLAKAFGMKIHVLTRSGQKSRDDSSCKVGTGDPDGSMPDRYFSETEKIEFLRSLDFLILALPLTKSTEGMVGDEELGALPKGAFVLNPARGPIIREESLLKALRTGHLGGAALDTHYHYPLWADHPLWTFPNVILTPHIAGTTFSPNFQNDLMEIFRENLGRYLSSQPLLNQVASSDLKG
jgi:phosphoglycerate dehydrogenase-like enzyme